MILCIVDVIKDLIKYKGTEQWIAAGLTTTGFLATLSFGAAIAFVAPAGVALAVGAIAGVGIGAVAEATKVKTLGND